MKARLDRPGGNTQCRRDLFYRQILSVKEVDRCSLLRRQLPDPSRHVDPMLHIRSFLRPSLRRPRPNPRRAVSGAYWSELRRHTCASRSHRSRLETARGRANRSIRGSPRPMFPARHPSPLRPPPWTRRAPARHTSATAGSNVAPDRPWHQSSPPGSVTPGTRRGGARASGPRRVMLPRLES